MVPPEPNEESPSWRRRRTEEVVVFFSFTLQHFSHSGLTIQMCPHTYYTISSNRECHSPIAHVMGSPTQSLGRRLSSFSSFAFARGGGKEMCRPTSKRGIVKEEKMKNWERESRGGGHLGETTAERKKNSCAHLVTTPK